MMTAPDRNIWLLIFGAAVLSAALYGVSTGIPAQQLVPSAASLLGLLIVILRTVQGTAKDDVRLTICGLLLFLFLAAICFLPFRSMIRFVIDSGTAKQPTEGRVTTEHRRGGK